MNIKELRVMIGVIQKAAKLAINDQMSEAEDVYYGLPSNGKQLFKELSKSVLLFTAGSVSTVRKPSSFNPRNVEDLLFVDLSNQDLQDLLQNLGILQDEWEPNYNEYAVAGQYMKALAASTDKSNPDVLYRGLTRLKANVLLDLSKPGTEWDLGDIVSTTYNKDVGQSFANGKKYRVLYVLDNSKARKGINVDNISAFHKEQEIVLGGKVRATKIEWLNKDFTPNQNWEGLKDAVTQIENGIEGVEVPLVTVFAEVLGGSQ